MRTIKFRAWDKENKIMLTGIDPFTQDRSKVEIMQFTGLRDKNEKEIFEGDIVVLYDEVKAHIVTWVAPCFNLMELDSSDMEVIGNIYENPELM